MRARPTNDDEATFLRPLRETHGPRHSLVVPKSAEAEDASTVQALVEHLCRLGVRHAFGVFGGAIAPFCRALNGSPIRLLHCRHEAGAAFAAIESSLASGKLTVVASTAGPGLTNLYTGMLAARSEGAKVLFVSGGTSAAQRGRMPFQETSASNASFAPLFQEGPLFDLARVVEDAAELDTIATQLSVGVGRSAGFVAHLGLPLTVQTARRRRASDSTRISLSPSVCARERISECVELLSQDEFVIWTGFGARGSASLVRELARVSGAPVMSTPRGKGTFAEGDPRYLGVTGLGGHERVIDFHRERPPARTLVLGTRLGEMSSFWEEALCPSQGFVHVDVDSSVFGRAFPRVPTVGVQADVETFLSELLAAWPAKRAAVVAAPFHEPAARGEAPGELATDQKPDPAQRGVLVRPSYLLGRVQEIIVDGTDGIVLTEAGNAFALGSHFLRFDEAGRYRVSTSFGSMGHAAAGVLGATLGSGRKAFAILGDGAMLMQNELNTAASCDIDAVWIVLNDARYGMIAQGMESVGWEPFGTDFVRTDFVAIARGMGADGVTVHDECEIDSALRRAVAAKGPFVVDVMIDPRERAPAIGRNQSLIAQGVNGRSL